MDEVDLENPKSEATSSMTASDSYSYGSSDLTESQASQAAGAALKREKHRNKDGLADASSGSRGRASGGGGLQVEQDTQESRASKQSAGAISINSQLIKRLSRRGHKGGSVLGLPGPVVEKLWKDEFGDLGLEHPEELQNVIEKRFDDIAKNAALAHASTRKTTKKAIRQMIDKEKEFIKQEKQVVEGKKAYWISQLSEDNKSRRDILDVYDDLYDHGRNTIEKSLQYLKEYYLFNPHDFDPRDPALTEKAHRFADRIKKKCEKYLDNNLRDKELARIFKEVKE